MVSSSVFGPYNRLIHMSCADYAKTKKALDTCPFCYQDDAPPKAQIVAMGHRTYLACTQNEELVDGHCLIVPLQHHLSMLELDDDGWDEVRVSTLSCR